MTTDPGDTGWPTLTAAVATARDYVARRRDTPPGRRKLATLLGDYDRRGHRIADTHAQPALAQALATIAELVGLDADADPHDVVARARVALQPVAHTAEQWCVFSGHPDLDGTLIDAFDDQADAEGLAPCVVDAHIARRTVSLSAWQVLARCSSCGSVLDGELCCDGRAAEIEAGEALLRVQLVARAVIAGTA